METDDDKPTIKVNKRPSIPDESIQMPWVEKYRPAKLEDLVAHEDIVSILTKLIDNDNLPHLLLYGPPGTGKVSGICPLSLEYLLVDIGACDVVSNLSVHVTSMQQDQFIHACIHSTQQTLTPHHLTDIDHSRSRKTHVRIHSSLLLHGPRTQCIRLPWYRRSPKRNQRIRRDTPTLPQRHQINYSR